MCGSKNKNKNNVKELAWLGFLLFFSMLRRKVGMPYGLGIYKH
jgi:hypothetical protein